MTSLSSRQIPAEVWTNVFRFLSEADKFNVRASCKHFMKLVDHWSLWRGWTVVLSFKNGSYNSQFWATLRRRKITGVVMKSVKAKHWKQLALSLPALTTVAMEGNYQGSLVFLKDFPHLKRLAVRNSTLLFDTNTLSQAQQLTHLSLCVVKFPATSKGSFVNALSQFTNLTSLVCHHLGFFEGSIKTIDTLLTCLPNLKQLSFSSKQTLPNSARVEPVGERASALSSLELINYLYHSLPENTMRLMPCLKSLALFHKQSHQNMPGGWSYPAIPLTTWLHDLSQLSTLVIANGPPVNMYAASIPATVTSLTLCVTGLSSEDIAAVALQVPDLLHLHIDPWPSHLGAHTAQIPQLFPKLKSLKLRHEHVPEKDFLQLHRLQDLEYLEILDNRQRVSDLAGKLRVLTGQRLQVATSPHQTDVLSCSCVNHLTSQHC